MNILLQIEGGCERLHHGQRIAGVEPEDREGPVDPCVHPSTERQDLDLDPGQLLSDGQQVMDLFSHDPRAADLPTQRGLVQHTPQGQGVLPA